MVLQCFTQRSRRSRIINHSSKPKPYINLLTYIFINIFNIINFLNGLAIKLISISTCKPSINQSFIIIVSQHYKYYYIIIIKIDTSEDTVLTVNVRVMLDSLVLFRLLETVFLSGIS